MGEKHFQETKSSGNSLEYLCYRENSLKNGCGKRRDNGNAQDCLPNWWNPRFLYISTNT